MKVVLVILIFISSIFSSCKTNAPETIDLDHIVAQSKDEKSNTDTVSKTITPVLTGLNDEDLLLNNIIIKAPRNRDTLLFLDRFSSKSSVRFFYSLHEDSVFYTKFNFKDSLKSKNAFFNWMNCFDTRCKSIFPGENKNLQKDGFLLLQNDTSIVYISSKSSNELLNWKKYYTSFENIQWKYILSQSTNGKVKWEYFTEKELQKLP